MWGRIAAANAASDVYAMGGTPFLALNLVGWNTEELSADLLAEVMIGARTRAPREAGSPSAATPSTTRSQSSAWW